MNALLLAAVLAADPVSYELKGNELVVPAAITFETGKATLKDESNAALEYVKGYLEAKKAISTLRIEVHSDSQGAEKFNQKLTEERAAAVANALISKGVDCKRLIAVGFGSSKPVAPNDSAEGRAQNRRVSFFNAALLNRAIGGMPLDGGGQVASISCH
ncbi:MAG: OmpA family protein [Myxococcaceae bacterium]